MVRSRKDVPADELLAKATADGYKHGAHQVENGKWHDQATTY